MKKIYLLMCLLCAGLWVSAQVNYEDFETGSPTLPWVGVNGAFNGAIANPGADAVNSSAYVGSYSTLATSDFCFAIADLPAPVDLSVNSLVKMKVWSPIAPTTVLFKFEGGGNAVEKTRNITVANQWVEYTFDLSAGAAMTTMNKVLVSFNPFVPASDQTFYFDDIRTVSAVECYETFESGNALPWAGGTGTFTGPVANPMVNSVNGSDNCGMYVKDAATGYSLLIADNGTTAFDLSVLNQFKMDVYATAPTQVLFKLEGTGPSIEITKNIGVVNAWQTYTFDMSAAAEYTGLTKVVIFFDPGTEGTSDTYYFDNICAMPKPAACVGAVAVPNMVDDFECNRNATYTNGWDALTVVDNPAPSGTNNSSKVGSYVDPIGEPWAALVVDSETAFDLSTFNQLKIKVWAPAATGQILFKLEGGLSPAVEIWQPIPTASAWVEYEVDFSGQSAANHKKIAIFFNGGQEPVAGDVYFIDDISWGELQAVAIEDFEGGAFLPWQPLDNNSAVHGVFSVVANPVSAGINTSAEVGKFVKGPSPFATVEAVAPAVYDISSKPQYNLDILAPTGATSVTMQLESPTLGNAEVLRDLSTPGAWENISFDFTDYQSTNDWINMKILFNPTVAESGAVYYFDNLTQSASTVDPCEGVVAIPNIIDDYECQRNYDYGAGAAQLSVVDNPSITATNSSTKVGQFDAAAGGAYQALCVEFPDGIDFSVYNQLEMLAWGPAVPVLCKLEGGTSPAVEIFTAITTAETWEKVSVDFSNQVGMDHKRVCVFLNGGVTPTEPITYYLDNLQFAHAPFDACIMTFEDPAFTSLVWNYFPAAESGGFEMIDNPDPSGINTSSKVGKATEKASGEQPWQGMYTDLPAPIRFDANKLVKMKVWSPQVATVTMKLENPATPGAPGSSGDNTVANTVANAWEDLTFDFSVSPNPIPDGGDYRRITLIWDIQNLPTSDVVYYFDDVRLDAAVCAPNGTNNVANIASMKVMPNPANDMIGIQNLASAVRLEITDLMGRRVATVNVGNDTQSYLNVSQFPAGMYLIGGYNNFGQLVANAKFIKM